MRLLVPIGRVTTTRAQLPDVIATVGDDLGLWQVFGGCDPGAWVGSVHTWTEHRVALLAQRFGPELYDKRLLGATRCSRYSLYESPRTHSASDTPMTLSSSTRRGKASNGVKRRSRNGSKAWDENCKMPKHDTP